MVQIHVIADLGTNDVQVIAATLIITKNCLSTCEWIVKLWYIHYIPLLSRTRKKMNRLWIHNLLDEISDLIHQMQEPRLKRLQTARFHSSALHKWTTTGIAHKLESPSGVGKG